MRLKTALLRGEICANHSRNFEKAFYGKQNGHFTDFQSFFAFKAAEASLSKS